MDKINTYVNRENLGERILFTGYVSDRDLQALYSSCAVCVYPSLYEGFGFPPLEAMACGAPVIASDIPVLREVTGGAALLLSPLDVQRMAESIVQMLTNHDKRASFTQAGIGLARQFTWEKTAQLTLEVYR